MKRLIRELIPQGRLEADAWPAYVLDELGLIVYVNRSWDREAQASGGPLSADVLGTRWLEHIHGDEPKEWHEALLLRLLSAPARRRGGCVLACDCNTPDRFRLFATRFSPMSEPGDGAVAGVLVVTQMLEDVPIGERYVMAAFDERRFLHAGGVLRQCGGCRRLLVTGSDPGVWEFVPEVVRHPRPNTSHGMCERCRKVYYGDLR